MKFSHLYFQRPKNQNRAGSLVRYEPQDQKVHENKGLAQLFPNAAGQWHYPTMLVLTIPAALLGAFIWSRTQKDRDGSRDEEGASDT